jgi:hypothetical protein
MMTPADPANEGLAHCGYMRFSEIVFLKMAYSAIHAVLEVEASSKRTIWMSAQSCFSGPSGSVAEVVSDANWISASFVGMKFHLVRTYKRQFWQSLITALPGESMTCVCAPDLSPDGAIWQRVAIALRG